MYRIDMQVHYRFIACAIMGIFLLIGFVNAASSAGTNPGFGSLPTSFEWEGDKILNGEDPTSLFTETKNGILDELAGAGMVMNSTSGLGNNTTTANATVNKTSAVPGTNDPLSGYASVGDIIRAQDWAALQRYTSSINATSEIPDSSLSLGNRNSNWDKLFKDPEPVGISCGPC
ncbi:hypothetical protein [Methanospirillum hungatei]|nr:hypothetical protein [Methanospirillum hungatei]